MSAEPRPRTTRRGTRRPEGPNLVLIGAVAVTVLMIQILVAYNATRGLPFVPTYNITVDVPDAAELAELDEVRIGGARVGQVDDVRAVTGPDGRPLARLKLKLDEAQKELPVDTRVEVRTRSLLGAKYLSLTPGKSDKGIPQDGRLTLTNADAGFELDDAFRIFDKKTTKGVRGAVGGFGGALAGRGAQLNQTLQSFSHLLPPAQRTLDALALPSTDLAGFIKGAATFSRALEPVAPELASFVDVGNQTFAAVDRAGPAVSSGLAIAPRAEASTTVALRKATRVLADTQGLLHDIRPGAAVLPSASRRLEAAIKAAPAALAPTTGATASIQRLGDALGRLAAGRFHLTGALRELTGAVISVRGTLGSFLPAQVTCNTLALWGRNLSSAVSQGNASGNWFRGMAVAGLSEGGQNAKPSSSLNANPAPNINSDECEAGTEPIYGNGFVGNPPGKQTTNVDMTRPPQDATARAARAGLLRRPPGVGR